MHSKEEEKSLEMNSPLRSVQTPCIELDANMEHNEEQVDENTSFIGIHSAEYVFHII